MRAIVRRPFRDLKAGQMREVGETFDTTEERIAEINGAGYGTLVETVREAPKPRRRTTKKE
jgi:hypothetical protein